MFTEKSDIPSLLKTGLQTIYQQALVDYGAAKVYDTFSMMINSNKSVEDYGWLSDTATTREWIGEREVKALGDVSYYIKNKKYESTVGVDREALEDDQYDAIKVKVQDMAYAADAMKNKLAIDMLVAGTAGLCYDGLPFFSTSHKYTSLGSIQTTQANLGTAAFTRANLKSSMVAMSKLVGTNGLPMGIMADTLLVPPDLYYEALEIVGSPINPDTGTSEGNGINALYSNNALNSVLKVVQSPFITDADSWYLFDTKRPLKPLIYQSRTNLEFQQLTENSETGIMTDKFIFGTRERFAFGYGLWQLAYANIPTT